MKQEVTLCDGCEKRIGDGQQTINLVTLYEVSVPDESKAKDESPTYNGFMIEMQVEAVHADLHDDTKCLVKYAASQRKVEVEAAKTAKAAAPAMPPASKDPRKEPVIAGKSL